MRDAEKTGGYAGRRVPGVAVAAVPAREAPLHWAFRVAVLLLCAPAMEDAQKPGEVRHMLDLAGAPPSAGQGGGGGICGGARFHPGAEGVGAG